MYHWAARGVIQLLVPLKGPVAFREAFRRLGKCAASLVVRGAVAVTDFRRHADLLQAENEITHSHEHRTMYYLPSIMQPHAESV